LVSSQIIECIPNFSEGRRPHIVAAIVEAITSASPVYLLDSSSDPDHNRSVVTFAGEPEHVLEAAFAGIRAAVSLIDLNAHHGKHPRIGAADVVPFVPLRAISLAECAELARRLGQRVGEELGLPVYLYEAAALWPERANLAVVRADPYERLRETIISDPNRAPDFGPSRLGPAGAVAIGARGPLIAFNAYLDTDDVSIAQLVARAVRTSGGGLPYLKALGLLVNGQAQVAMNVVDFRRTSLFDIMEAVRREAAKHGATVTHTELVGLIPQAALIETALLHLGLPLETSAQILENRLGSVTGDYREIFFDE
jgi:glutamate formiminotransferase